MFEASLIESTPHLQTWNRCSALCSFGLQAAVVATLILIPMLHPEVLPLSLPRLQVATPRFVPPAPPPIPHPVRTQTATAAVSAPARTAILPSRGSFTDAHTVDTPELAAGVNLGERGANPLAMLTRIAPRGAAVTVAGSSVAPRTAGPVRMTSGVVAGMLLAPILPQYPAIAEISHTEGTVVVEAIISTTGHLESAHVLSGPAMLQASALEAVREARYRPFLLNGQPTEVSTTISINFRFGS